ncbi:hypothetical protein CaCOL14_013182 [Colletotrichum acutatum]
MTSSTPSTIVGCLLDVSASMREALATNGLDERVTDCLNAVLHAALKLAQSEGHHNPTASFFIGVFELDTDNGYPLAIDLCEVIRVPHIKEYILQKLTVSEARIIDAHLECHQEKIKDFVNAIPSEEEIRTAKENTECGGAFGCGAAGLALGGLSGATIGGLIGLVFGELAADRGIENSEALRLARCMGEGWLKTSPT